MEAISGIGHVAIRVKDIAQTLEFYVARLGFREMFRLDRDGKLWIVYLRITDDQYLEVFPDGEGERPDNNSVGYNHLCLVVSDMGRVLAELAAAGVPLVQARKTGLDGNEQAWIADPDGHRIELMQMAADGLQAKAIARLARERAG
jgi:lactoylglutathione lyase